MKKILTLALSIAFIGVFGQAKISDLPATTTLTGVELFPVVQGGVTKKTTAAQIASLSAASATNYVPYTGATGSVNLGVNSFSTTGGVYSNYMAINNGSLATGLNITADETGNVFPFIIDATTVNSDLILQSGFNSRYKLKNKTTSVQWLLSNNTATTGIGLDGFSIGTSSNPNAGFLQIGASGSVLIGANPANTTTLGGLTLGYNTTSGMMHFGKFSATSNSIWGYNTSTPTTSNYNLNFNATDLYLAAPTNINFVIGGTQRFSYNTTRAYSTLPMRIGSNINPNATLDVTGTMSVSSTGTISSIVLSSNGINMPNLGQGLTMTKGINTTAGDAATLNYPIGRFRKDTSGSSFTLTNSFITANSIILLTKVTTGITAGYNVTVQAGAGSAVFTFETAGIASAPNADFDINFFVIN